MTNSNPRGRRAGEPGIAPAPKNGGRPSGVWSQIIQEREVSTAPRPRRAIDKRRDAQKKG